MSVFLSRASVCGGVACPSAQESTWASGCWRLRFSRWPRGGSYALASAAHPPPSWRAPGHRHTSRPVPPRLPRGLPPPPPRCLVSLAQLPAGPRWRKPDRNQAPCASAPDQVLPALWPLGRGAHGGTGQAAASYPQGQALETLTERPGAEFPPCHVVTVGPQRYPLPCSIYKSKTNLIPEPA